MNITHDILYVGVNDKEIDLFEGQYAVRNGMCYNSYLICDKKTAVTDSVDAFFVDEWLDNIRRALNGKKPDYLIVHHMEPDHSAGIMRFAEEFKDAVIVSSAKAFAMMKNYFGTDFADRRIVVGEGDTLKLGRHTLTFLTAPMVHWPEVIVSYDSADKVLFSADGFGKFGAYDAPEAWTDEARRYYIGIVGKYGAQVTALLKKAAALDISVICPLHGPVLKENLGYYIDLYSKWASYTPEKNGTVIAYASVYGHTEAAARLLGDKLWENGGEVKLYDLARCDMSKAVSDAFAYSNLVLASVTYNGDVFPCMREFVNALAERNFRGRTVGIIENGSWAPMAAKVITGMLEKCRDIKLCENTVKVMSALNDDSRTAADLLAKELLGNK